MTPADEPKQVTSRDSCSSRIGTACTDTRQRILHTGASLECLLNAERLDFLCAQRCRVLIEALARIGCPRNLPICESEGLVKMVVVLIRMDQDFVRREMPRQRFENCHWRRPRGVEQKHYILGHHLVAFLDVLGQRREQLRQLRLPETPDEETHAKELIKNTAGYVLGLRQLFQTQFEMFEKGAQMDAYTKEPVRPNFVGFSDSFVTPVALRDDGTGLVRVVTVFSALSAAAVVMIRSLAPKHALRGGIEVGLAAEIGPGGNLRHCTRTRPRSGERSRKIPPHRYRR